MEQPMEFMSQEGGEETKKEQQSSPLHSHIGDLDKTEDGKTVVWIGIDFILLMNTGMLRWGFRV